MTRPTDWQSVLGIPDPTPGDPYEVRAMARRWGQVADAAELAEGKLRGFLGDGAVTSWIGDAGDAFRSHSSDLPGQLGKAKDSYRHGSEALSWWAGRLEIHQHDADRALEQGRQAKIDLEAAQARLADATHGVSAAAGVDVLSPAAAYAAHPPTSEQITAARGRLEAAQAAQSRSEGLVSDARSRLDAARRLAEDAGSLRRSEGRTAAQRVHEAADAGIKPRSRWEKIKDGLAKAWDILITIAKVVVAVLGVVALIIGGPLAWIVFAAALLVLADTLVKYFKGQASALDVLLAAVSCIPGTKGLTTLAALKGAFQAGGVIGAVAHVATAGLDAIKALKTLPTMANDIRKGLVPSIKAAVEVLGEGTSTVSPSLRTTLREMSSAFSQSMGESRGLLTEARNWQGSGSFPGVDDYSVVRLQPGTNLEVGFPGVSNYSMPGGTAAANGHSASGVWEGVQVGPQDLTSAYPGYRGSMVELHVNNPTNMATGTTLANPEYGAGGTTQYFADLKAHIANGNISVLDHAGQPIPMPHGITPDQVNGHLGSVLGGSGTISLHGAGSWNPGIMTQQQVAATTGHLGSGANAPVPTMHELNTILRGAGYVSTGADVVGAR